MSVGLKSTKIYLKEDEYDIDDEGDDEDDQWCHLVTRSRTTPGEGDLGEDGEEERLLPI